MMRVDAALRLRLEHTIIGLEALGDAVHGERAARVRHIDAVRPIAFHELRLRRQRVGRAHMAHHQEAQDIHAEFARGLDMLLRDVGLGAMGCDANRPHAHAIGSLQIVDRADARQEQRRQLRMGQHLGDRADPVPVGMGPEAVVEARAREPVAMRDLDRVDLSLIERLRDRLHMIEAILMADRMHAVPERHVLNVEFALRFEAAHQATLLRPRSTMRSAVFSAAEVMMSRLPA